MLRAWLYSQILASPPASLMNLPHAPDAMVCMTWQDWKAHVITRRFSLEACGSRVLPGLPGNNAALSVFGAKMRAMHAKKRGSNAKHLTEHDHFHAETHGQARAEDCNAAHKEDRSWMIPSDDEE